jgi:uncharacterized membrane protein
VRIRTLVLVGATLIAGMLALAAWALTQLAADSAIPVHWGLDGRADGYAPAWLGLLGMPALATIALGLLAFLPRVEPRQANLVRSFTAYVSIGIAVIVLVAVLHVAIVVTAVGGSVDVAAVALSGVGVLFIVIGNFLGKTRSNWTLGLRTPWTLSSERSWTRTHRLGGLVFIADGIVVIATTLLFGASIAIWLMFALLAAGLVAVVAYSYVVWRDDPARSAER